MNRSICDRARRSSVTLNTTAEGMAEGDRREAREQVGVLGLVPVGGELVRSTDENRVFRRGTAPRSARARFLKVCSGSSWRARSSRRLQASWAVSVM